MDAFSYAIVQVGLSDFPDNGIFIVPIQFLTYTMDSEIYVKYLLSPFSEDDLQLLEGIIKTKDSVPPEDWALLQCEVLHYCSKYSAQVYILR